MVRFARIARWGIALCAALLAAPAAAERIELDSKPIVLSPTNPGLVRVGALTYRGGLQLTSPDDRFGGVSGLLISADGDWLTAVTDTGHWFEARLDYTADGRLAGLADARLTPLRGENGRPLSGKRASDSESLARAPDGTILVSFERDHRVLRYTGTGETAAPVAFTLPGLSAARRNGGLEAMGTLADGRLLLLTEDHFVADGRLAGWLVDGGNVAALTYPGNGYFKPTGLTRLPDGRVLVLERGFSVVGGPKARIMMIDPPDGAGAINDLTEIARLQPPVQIDNYEGLAARTSESGETLLYIASDDNFNALQRTLLLMFAFAE